MGLNKEELLKAMIIEREEEVNFDDMIEAEVEDMKLNEIIQK